MADMDMGMCLLRCLFCVTESSDQEHDFASRTVIIIKL